MGARKENRGPSTANIHMTKKCPECFAYLPLHATACTSCGKRVGPADQLGHARKPPNIKG